MEIEKVVEEKFAEICNSGFIEERIKESLEKTIKDAVIDATSSYSGFGKDLKEKVKKALDVEGLKFDFPSYNQLILNWTKEIVNNEIIATGKKQVEEKLKTLFKPLEKTEWKISEIIEEFIQTIKGSDEGNCGEISFHCENLVSDTFVVGFDRKPDKKKYACDYQLAFDKNGLYSCTIDGVEASSMKNPSLYGFDVFLFKLLAVKAKIINDSDKVDVEYYFGDED